MPNEFIYVADDDPMGFAARFFPLVGTNINQHVLPELAAGVKLHHFHLGMGEGNLGAAIVRHVIVKEDFLGEFPVMFEEKRQNLVLVPHGGVNVNNEVILRKNHTTLC